MASLELGISRYEIGIFSNGKILEVFRTDIRECQPSLLEQAEQRVEVLRRDNPQGDYSISRVPKNLKVRNAGLVYL